MTTTVTEPATVTALAWALEQAELALVDAQVALAKSKLQERVDAADARVVSLRDAVEAERVRCATPAPRLQMGDSQAPTAGGGQQPRTTDATMPDLPDALNVKNRTAAHG